MDNIGPIHAVSQSTKVNKAENSKTRQDLGDKTNSAINYKLYDIRLLHYNVQSLSNKLLDIAVILATDYYNINILCFTEHWLTDVQLQVLNIDDFKLVNNFSRATVHQGDHAYL